MTIITCLMPECKHNTRTNHRGGNCGKQIIKIDKYGQCADLETDFEYITLRNQEEAIQKEA